MKRPLLAALALLTSACSLWVKSDYHQCDLDADCAGFAAGSRCVAQVCLAPPDGGLLGPPGCFAGVPTNDLEFANACTTASFLTFDNCARAGLCDGGSAPPSLVKPDAGPPAPSAALDGGVTETCYDAALRPNVVFINGSTNFTPFIRAMTPLLQEANFVVVWQPTSSCTGADTIFNDLASRRVMRNPTTTAQSYASYYTNANLPNGTPCLLGGSPAAVAAGLPAGQEPVDLGQSDIYATSCPPTGTSPFDQYVPEQGAYADVRHYLGPVQSMAFVVPAGSSQRVISAEAARLVFGLGGTVRPVTPWTDPAYLWVRSATTGTNGIISRGIDVPPTAWWGVDQRSAPNLVAQLKTVSTGEAEKTIGTLSIDFADREKDNLHILYFQPRGALAGFLPDLKPFTRDKENVRDGHYPLWGPIHLYARQQPGVGLTAGAATFVGLFTVAHPDQKLLDATIETGNVPTCAMKVARDTEMGPLKPFTPTFQCHCYYEKKLNGGNGCTPCTGPAECPSERPACNLGYCEQQ